MATERVFFKVANSGSFQMISPTGVAIAFNDGFGHTTDDDAISFLNAEVRRGSPVVSKPTDEEVKVFENALEYSVNSATATLLAEHEAAVLLKYGIDPNAVSAVGNPVSTMSSGIATSTQAIAAQTPELAANAAGTQQADANAKLMAMLNGVAAAQAGQDSGTGTTGSDTPAA